MLSGHSCVPTKGQNPKTIIKVTIWALSSCQKWQDEIAKCGCYRMFFFDMFLPILLVEGDGCACDVSAYACMHVFVLANDGR